MRDDLTDEHVYDQDRLDRHIWSTQRRTGLTRRQVLQLLSTALGAAAAGVFPGSGSLARADHTGPFVKPIPPDLFLLHGTNAETRFEAMKGRGFYTPNELFFVRNHTRTPHVDPSSWRLRIEGSAVEEPVELTYDDILSLDPVTETKFIECAGNGRSFFHTQQGTRASGTQWKMGAIGVAEWTGARLSDVLELADVDDDDAVDVMPEGLDDPVPGQGRVRRPLSIEKALEDTLVVYGMNGQPLPPDHGGPVRLLVPGWVGIANIKWLGRIEVANEPLFSPWNTTSYRFFGPAYPDSPLLTTQAVKSAFELPHPAALPVGDHVITGRSWSAHGKIEAVEVSFDGGGSWHAATLDRRNIPKAWVQWSIAWHAGPGTHILMARATDRKGNVQPASVPHNTQGYLFWAVVKHPVTVS